MGMTALTNLLAAPSRVLEAGISPLKASCGAERV